MHTKLKAVIKQIQQGTPALTVNSRLSRYLSACYDDAMRVAGCTMWQTPLIIPFQTWIEALWNESWPEESVISLLRSSILWDKIISKDNTLSDREILLQNGVAKTAYDACVLMAEYNLSFAREEIYLTEEAKALNRWKAFYDKELEELGLIDHLLIPEKVRQLVKEERVALPENVVVAGFDEMNPQTESLITAIQEKGCRVSFWPHEPVRSRMMHKESHQASFAVSEMQDRLIVRNYPDETEEVIQTARWIRKIMKPGLRVGIIVPDITRYRKIISKEFSAELDPHAVLPWEERTDLFNISMGATLYEEPIVKSALDILSVDEWNDMRLVSSILHSPFICTNEGEYHALSRLDADLKQMNYLGVSLAHIVKRIKSSSDSLSKLSYFRKRVERWMEMLKRNKGNALPESWADSFSQQLKGLGWPSIKIKNSEYQALKVWNELLEGFQSLNDILGEISRRDALKHLTNIVKQRIHQRELPECAIQVLGTLEASGQYFDHLWILGAHEYAFPGQPSPHPFIPVHLQKRFNLPHSSPEREFAFSQVVIKRLLNSAPDITISYPSVMDEKAVRLSPFFDLSHIQRGKLNLEDNCRLMDGVHSKKALENMPYEENIPVTDEELEFLSGGVSILKNQSACPFKSFATHRLNASAIIFPEPGLSPAERGSIVHSALAFFWKELKSSEKLREVPIGNLIKDSVNKAINDHHHVKSLPEKYRELEKVRVEELINEWIQLESEREGFEVLAVECEKEIALGKLKIKTRFDRLDRLQDGREAVIDYKTGTCSKKDWLTDRPRDPQLLLYNLSGCFDAIAFAQVKPGDLKFIGLSRYDGMLPGVKSLENDGTFLEALEGVDSWEALMCMWKKNLEKLAESFIQGDVRVDPYEYGEGSEKPCRYCEHTPFCRVFEAE